MDASGACLLESGCPPFGFLLLSCREKRHSAIRVTLNVTNLGIYDDAFDMLSTDRKITGGEGRAEGQRRI